MCILATQCFTAGISGQYETAARAARHVVKVGDFGRFGCVIQVAGAVLGPSIRPPVAATSISAMRSSAENEVASPILPSTSSPSQA